MMFNLRLNGKPGSVTATSSPLTTNSLIFFTRFGRVSSFSSGGPW